MLSLARREATLTIDLEDDEVPGLSIVMETLTDGEAARLTSARMRSRMDEEEFDEETVTIEMPYDEMMALFPKKFVAFDGDDVEVDNEEFNAKDATHVAALPLAWKMKTMAQLVSYAMILPKAMVKNSLAQATDSLPDSTSSEVALA